MKKLLLAALVIGIAGCSDADNKVIKNAIASDAAKYPEAIAIKSFQDNSVRGFDLEMEWEFNLAEEYGTDGFKAIWFCHKKFQSELGGIDTSTDYGAAVLDKYDSKVQTCATHSVQRYSTPIPEDKRKKLDRPYAGVELSPQEIGTYDELPVAPYDKNSQRYKEVLAMCAGANNYIKDDKEFVSAVDFCVSKAM